jgi:hypothetical protein
MVTASGEKSARHAEKYRLRQVNTAFFAEAPPPTANE